MMRVTAPDGSVVNFPDDTPEETINSVMQQNFGKQPTGDEEVSVPEYVPPPDAVVGGPTGTVKEPGTGTLELVSKLKKDGPSARPPEMTLEEFRGLTDQPRIVDKYGIGTALEVAPAVAGSVLGATAGTTVAGPVGTIPGSIVGGAVGSGGGRQLRRLAQKVEDYMTYGESDKTPLGEQAADIGEAIKTDLTWSGGLASTGRLLNLVFPALGRLTGIQKGGKYTADVQEAVDRARDAGINASAITMDKPFYRMASRVLLVMPVVGGPTKTAQEVAGAQISMQYERLLNNISPAIDLPRLGVKMSEAAEKTLNARKAISTANYKAVEDAFEAIGNPAVVPSAGLKESVAEIFKNIDDLPKTKEGVPIGFSFAESEKFMDELKNFNKLPEYITPKELRALQENLNLAAKARSGGTQMAPAEFGIIRKINGASWDALKQASEVPEGMRLGSDDALPTQLAAISTLVKRANKSWEDVKGLEETAAAGLVKRTDRNFFRAGFEKPGTAEIDELADIFLSAPGLTRSPEFVGNVTELIGPENRRSLARAVMARAAGAKEGIAGVRIDPETLQATKGSQDIAVFDAEKMRSQLGLTDPEKVLGAGALRKNKQALDALLEGTGLNANKIDSFLKTVAAVQRSPVGDPSTFLTRRIIFSGGPGALLPTAGAAGAAGAAAASYLTEYMSLGMFVLSTRAFSRLISTPRGLEILRKGLDPSLTKQQAFMLAERITRTLPDVELNFEGDWEKGAKGEWERSKQVDWRKREMDLLTSAEKRAAAVAKRFGTISRSILGD